MGFNRLGKVYGLLLVCALLIGVGSGIALAEEPLRIGAIWPLTGTCAKPGTGCANAIQLAVDEINNAGGVYGRPLELIIEDDEAMPTVSVAAAEKLAVRDKVHVVIGAFNSSCVLAHMQVTQREGVPQIDPVAFAATITRSGNPYMFRNIPQAELLGTKFAEFMLEESGAKTWAIIHENTDYGMDFRRFIKPILDKNAKVVAVETYTPGDTDFYAQLTKIKNLKPEAILQIANMTEGAQIMNQIRELGIEGYMFATGSSATQQYRDLAGPAADGLYTLSFLESSAPQPKVQEFLKNFEAKFGYEPDYFAAAAYDATYLAAEGMKKAYEKNVLTWPSDLKKLRNDIRDGINAVDGYPGVQGIVKWNEHREAATDIYWVQWKDGKKQIVKILPAEENVMD